MARYDDALAFLNDPTRVTIYPEEEREIHHYAAEERTKKFDRHYKIKPYVRKTEAERKAQLEKIARRYASKDYGCCTPDPYPMGPLERAMRRLDRENVRKGYIR
jgi:hypothetical protein